MQNHDRARGAAPQKSICCSGSKHSVEKCPTGSVSLMRSGRPISSGTAGPCAISTAVAAAHGQRHVLCQCLFNSRFRTGLSEIGRGWLLYLYASTGLALQGMMVTHLLHARSLPRGAPKCWMVSA